MEIVPQGYVCPPLNAVSFRDPKAVRSWCGPSAVSAITGQPVDDVATWIWERRGRKGTPRGVRGTMLGEVTAALAAAGFASRFLQGFAKSNRPTLTQWLKARSKEVRRCTCLINAGHHWIVVRGNKLVDSYTKEPVFIRRAPHRRSRVVEVCVIFKPTRKRVKAYEPSFRL